MPLHSTGQSAPLHVFPHRTPFFHRVGGIDALDVLLDDWALGQVSGDVVRGCPDQFYAPVICLVVGTRALETGQEGVVNVDDASSQIVAQRVRQDLHIAGQNHQVGVEFSN